MAIISHMGITSHMPITRGMDIPGLSVVPGGRGAGRSPVTTRTTGQLNIIGTDRPPMATGEHNFARLPGTRPNDQTLSSDPGSEYSYRRPF